jgi:hypothetical protein
VGSNPAAPTSKYELALNRRAHRERGIHIKAEIQNPAADAVNKFIDDNAPKNLRGPLKFASEAFIHKYKIDVQLEPPKKPEDIAKTIICPLCRSVGIKF